MRDDVADDSAGPSARRARARRSRRGGLRRQRFARRREYLRRDEITLRYELLNLRGLDQVENAPPSPRPSRRQGVAVIPISFASG